MSHDHHHHHHHEEPGAELSFSEKLKKILEHWQRHNEDHAETYRSWAEKARQNGMERAAGHLETAARMTMEINGEFQDAQGEAE